MWWYIRNVGKLFRLLNNSGVGGQGSGVIISDSHGYYYILTNSHVTYCEPDYPKVEYKIFDYKMNEYNGTLLNSSADYDLAVVYFKKNKWIKSNSFGKGQS